MSKVCSRCRESKPLSSYNKNAAKKDGLQYLCRECQMSNSKAYRDKSRAERGTKDNSTGIVRRSHGEIEVDWTVGEWSEDQIKDYELN